MEPEKVEKTNRVFVYSVFLYLIILLISSVFYFWQKSSDLSNMNSRKVRNFFTRLAESQISFIDANEIIFPDNKKFADQKNEYIKNKTDFIEANLKAMRLTLYKEGKADKILEILTKGREGSWWETPTGNYKVLGKSKNAYSSIGNVWMPYSIQFYGNYFIHGWPYHDDGSPVPQSYSGGCIRLSTKDAKIVFDFAKSGMPILVQENNSENSFGTLISKNIYSNPPQVEAKSFLISDLSSGEIILEKKSEEKLSIASITKLMTAVVAHEVIYLGRSIKVTPNMLANASQIFYPSVGENYIGLDLLYPLLMQSSNDSAKVLSGFIGEENFVRNMNIKAISLQMDDTQFVDASGISDQNTSTASDLSKLLQYIYYKRPFLFDISKGVAFENIGLIKIGNTIEIKGLKNVNEFVDNPDLIGVKNGQTTTAEQTMITVWNIHTNQGDIPLAIIILGSKDRKSDTEALLGWFKNNYEVL